MRSTGVDADWGKDLDYASPFSGPRLSEVSERVESLRFAEATSDRLFSSKDAGASREALIALTRFYGEFAGFSAGGCYVYDPRVEGYRLFLSYGSEDGYVGLAKLGEKVDAAVLDPYFERAEKDFPLFVSTAQGLGKDFATELLSLGISSLFLYPVRNGTNPPSGTEYSGGVYGLIFRAAVSGITGVQVDGRTVGRGSYTVEGSYPVELYLKASYLNRLAKSSHTLTVLTDSGSLTAAFTVGSGKSSPTTFDAGIAVYAAAAVTSLTGLELLRRRRKEEE